MLNPTPPALVDGFTIPSPHGSLTQSATLAEGRIAAMLQPGYDPLDTMIAMPRWLRLWRLWRAARRGR